MVSVTKVANKTNSAVAKFESLNIQTNKYTVRLAESWEEVELALKLRFEVFNLELDEGLPQSYINMMDEDEFDKQFHHLLVIENATDKVIGTYRVQDSEMAEKGHGFYTASEFTISLFPFEVIFNGIELGRACIHKEHRNGRVLFLLWKAIAKYLVITEKRYLFGCCSLTSQSTEEAWMVFNYLTRSGHLHQSLNIPVEPTFQCPGRVVSNQPEIELPKLFQLYLQIGAKVCSSPAIDRTFKSIDFLILLDLKTIKPETKNLFFK